MADAEMAEVRCCPRCGIAMQELDYEGVTLDQCNRCWGFWLDTGELEEILAQREANFGEEERHQLQEIVYGSAYLEREEVPLPCPICDKDMRKHRLMFSPEAALILDTCRQDGVWMDSGELQAAQLLVDQADTLDYILSELRDA